MGHETALTAEETALAEIISLATRGRPRAALGLASRAAAGDAPPHPAQLAAVCAVARFGASDFDTAAELGETALQLSGHRGETDPPTRVLAVSARLLSSAGSLWAGVDRRIDDHLAAELIAAAPEVAELPSAIRPYTIALLVEALFANGRIADAEHCLCILLGDHWASTPVGRLADGPPLPSLPFLPVRMLFYAGRTAEAEELLLRVLELPDVRRDPLWPRLADALIALCAAARGESARARAAAQRVAIAFPRPRHYLDGSARVLAGHGLAVIGELGRAAHELKAGGGSGLRRLAIVDQALAAEALMREALLRENLRDATRWARLLLGLEAHPAVPEISLRAFAQLDLASGAADSALRRSEAALARSRLTGAMRDSAENELLRCRTLIALGRRAEAVTELQRIAVSARSRGDEAGRRDAARQLRALGQRIAPERGSGWGSLSEREQEVAVLAAQGFGNRAIGDAVFLSPRTVSGIIARIMVAFDVPRRSALAAAIRPEVPRPEAAPLTRRQVEVVGLISRGLTNTEIAVELGISPRTVERHVSAALAASGAGSRTALAHLSLVGASRPASG